MSIPPPIDVPVMHLDSWGRLSEFAVKSGRTLEQQLGWGNEGLVYSTTSKTAIKAYLHQNLFENEKKVYARLTEYSVKNVHGFDVPQFVSASDDLRTLEMSIVSPPFIIDFAGAYLDKRPPFDPEQWEDWEAAKVEQFEDRWPTVRSLISAFVPYGIHLNDVHPGNVMFAET
jgi:hypothetical protein